MSQIDDDLQREGIKVSQAVNHLAKATTYSCYYYMYITISMYK